MAPLSSVLFRYLYFGGIIKHWKLWDKFKLAKEMYLFNSKIDVLRDFY